MSGCVFQALFALLLLVGCQSEDDLQKWSVQTMLNDNITLECHDEYNTTGNFVVSSTDSVTWRKKDHDGSIQSNDVYKLGANNMNLTFTVTDETNGIYFCEVRNGINDQLIGVIVKGLNVGIRDYEDFLDQYERNLIVAGISAGSVLFLVMFVGLVAHCHYQSEEQIAARKARREERKRRREQNGYDNTAVSTDEGLRNREYHPNQHDMMKTSF